RPDPSPRALASVFLLRPGLAVATASEVDPSTPPANRPAEHLLTAQEEQRGRGGGRGLGGDGDTDRRAPNPPHDVVGEAQRRGAVPDHQNPGAEGDEGGRMLAM